MKRTIILSAIAFLLVIVSLGYFVWFRPSQAEAEKPIQNAETQKTSDNLIAAPGVVEAVSEEIEVGAEIGGKLKEVAVEEGTQVVRGQVIAILENSDLTAQIAVARAEIEILRREQETARARQAEIEAGKLRIVNGSRPEERLEAKAGYEQTVSLVEQASREAARRQKLYEAGDISREEMERATRELQTAEAKGREMREKFNVVNAPARGDEVQKADAAIEYAKAQIREFDSQILVANARVREAEARFSKTIVRAPISGVILRKRLKTGESFSPENSSNGIVTIGDVSALRIRVEIDETDVARIRENQRAFVTADAYGKQKFAAKVVKIGQILGRKKVRTEEPTEKVDKKILEVLLELEPNQKLPLGLRVNAFIGDE